MSSGRVSTMIAVITGFSGYLLFDWAFVDDEREKVKDKKSNKGKKDFLIKNKRLKKQWF